MKKSFAKLIEEANAVESLLIDSHGEVTPQIEELIKLQQTDIAHKVESYSYLMDHSESKAEFYKQQAEFWLKLSKAHNNFSKMLKDRMKFHMQLWGVTEIQGFDIKFTLSKSNPSLIIENQELVPDKFKDVVTTIEIRNNELKAALKKEPIAGARLEESFSLRKTALKSPT